MDFRSNLSKPKGLVASGDGTHHWLMQRLSALFLVLLMIWFLQFIYGASSKNIILILQDLQKPYNCCGLALFVLASLYHSVLGMQVIIEDYVANLCMRYSLIIALRIFSIITAAAFLVALFYLLTI
jgi:succinate dehydrogenase / fumarate reductase membrane anchor subunit